MSSRVNIFSGRIAFVQLLFVAAFLLLIGRLFYIQIYQDTFLKEKVISRSHSEYSILASRGKIMDRNGNVLALDVPSFSVGIDLSKFPKSANEITLLSNTLNINEDFLISKFLNQNKGFKEITRHIDLNKRMEIEALNIKGIYFRHNLRRSYTQDHLVSHVVGLTDIDRKGIQGTELVFNNLLRGKEGGFVGTKVTNNMKIDGTRREPEPGKDIRLSIDIRMQSIAYENLERAIIEHNAQSGSIVILDPKKAEILAITNYPSFNPKKRKNIEDFSSLRNRATIDVFEPGSVLKPLAMAAMLDSGSIPSSLKIQTSPGWIEVSGYKTYDFKDYGELNLSEIISLSSNVGMVKLCANESIESLRNYYLKFGIGQYPLNILIPSREGFIPLSSEFSLRDKVSSCYGYGLTMSALQIAQAYSVFANEGKFKELNLFLDNEFKQNNQEEVVLSDSTSDIIKHMLIEAVNSDQGTARRARINGYTVAGKTGTAMESLADDTTYTATFSGFVPARDPELLGVVVIRGLSGEDHSGGKIAAPIFSDTVGEILNLIEVGI
tara:strand:- start:26007 stop:27659 length:1653 start_codon:yes stop_codon:yes gene_type:complete